MAVTSEIELKPSSVTGPPDVLIAFGTLAGAAGGGNSTIVCPFPAGWLWMINQISFGSSAITALEFGLHLNDQDDTVTGGFTTMSHVGELGAQTTFSNRDLFTWPRMIFRTTTRPANLTLQTLNIDATEMRLYVRALRWRKNDPPRAWEAYLVSPP